MDAWTISRVLAWAAADLRERGSESPRLDAELLLAAVLGCDRIRLIIDHERPLETHELEGYRALHKRRRRGEPIAYLRGEREFYGRPFFVDPRVLVPRPETELLVETALARTRKVSLSARVLDLCTGSGCVAVTIKKERPTNSVHASDISVGALEVARLNARRLGALVAFTLSDLFEKLQHARGRLDLIVANPPYIPEEEVARLPADVRDFEPRIALSSGQDGLELTQRLVQGASGMLAANGVLALEVDAPSADKVAELMTGAGFEDVEIARDYAGRQRVVSARRHTPY
ncbi:MAG: peptide chain release factor N(5)-glutamine methyltransferase [Myxococcales bacterium]|nr:peptide chain release factor N(5)-glutamine methyltransferase [Myxococcales bacterium]